MCRKRAACMPECCLPLQCQRGRAHTFLLWLQESELWREAELCWHCPVLGGWCSVQDPRGRPRSLLSCAHGQRALQHSGQSASVICSALAQNELWVRVALLVLHSKLHLGTHTKAVVQLFMTSVNTEWWPDRQKHNDHYLHNVVRKTHTESRGGPCKWLVGN